MWSIFSHPVQRRHSSCQQLSEVTMIRITRGEKTGIRVFRGFDVSSARVVLRSYCFHNISDRAWIGDCARCKIMTMVFSFPILIFFFFMFSRFTYSLVIRFKNIIKTMFRPLESFRFRIQLIFPLRIVVHFNRATADKTIRCFTKKKKKLQLSWTHWHKPNQTIIRLRTREFILCVYVCTGTS